MKKFVFLFCSLLMLNIISCTSPENPEIINQEELITILRITLTPQNGGNSVVLQLQDLDGDGPIEPKVSVSGNLQKNTNYNGTVLLLNETQSPAENITKEVEEEGVDHQFFYTFSNSFATVTYTDNDANGNPIGINFRLVTNTAGIGNVTVTLRHLPNKAGTGVKAGDITNAGGETDISATFNLTVQ